MVWGCGVGGPDAHPTVGGWRDTGVVKTETTENGKPICPVCGTVGWFDQIDVSMSQDPPWGNARTVDGQAHCPHENDDRHIDWWRDQWRSHRNSGWTGAAL